MDAGIRAWEKAITWSAMGYALVVTVLLLSPRRCTVRACWAELCSRLRPKVLTPEEVARERRVRAEKSRRRVERARLFLILSNFATFFHVPLIVMSASMDKLNGLQLLTVTASLFLRSTFALLSSRLTPKGVDAFYCSHILLVTIYMASHKLSVEAISQDRATMLVILLFWGVGALKPWLNGLGLLCAATAETLTLCLAGGFSSAVCGWFVYSAAFGGLLGLDHCLTKSVRMEILAGDSENELVAIKTLLDAICDVVVKLDRRLRLKQHSPKLAEVLLVHAPGRSLEGEDLRCHMAAARDRAIFTERLQGSGAASAHASVFHAKMRDSAGSSIDMEFFSVGFKGRDGERHHILGMREFTDIRPVLPPQLPEQEPPRPLPLPAHGPPPPPPVPPLPQLPLRPQITHALVEASLLSEQVEPRLGIVSPAELEWGDVSSRSSSSPRAPSSRSGSPVHEGGLLGDSGSARNGPAPPLPPAEVIGVPLAAPPPSLLPPLPMVRAPPAPPHGRGERRIGLGTPAVLEQNDIRSHRSSSPRAPSSAPSGQAPVPTETPEFVRELTVNYLLSTWDLLVPRSACCAKHTAILCLESLVGRMKSRACVQDFALASGWQCPRCRIRADEYRDPRHRSRCLLCKHIDRSHLRRSSDEGSKMAI